MRLLELSEIYPRVSKPQIGKIIFQRRIYIRLAFYVVRVDEYNTAKALKDEQERKALYDKFAAVASKYLGLEYDKKSVYIAIIAQKPSDLIHEGELLHHCVGRMGYDQKFAREESLIFFIRTKEQPDVPFVTVEYSPITNGKQVYGT